MDFAQPGQTIQLGRRTLAALRRRRVVGKHDYWWRLGEGQRDSVKPKERHPRIHSHLFARPSGQGLASCGRAVLAHAPSVLRSGGRSKPAILRQLLTSALRLRQPHFICREHPQQTSLATPEGTQRNTKDAAHTEHRAPRCAGPILLAPPREDGRWARGEGVTGVYGPVFRARGGLPTLYLSSEPP